MAELVVGKVVKCDIRSINRWGLNGFEMMSILDGDSILQFLRDLKNLQFERNTILHRL